MKTSHVRKRLAADSAAKLPSATVFPSALGWMAIVFEDGLLCELTFGHRSRRLALASLSRRSPPIATNSDDIRHTRCDLAARLQRYALGTADDFRDVAADSSWATPFGRRVIAACRRVDVGQTASYSALAARAGSPQAARAVGQWMARNRVPIVVPCHRIVGADGTLHGYSAAGGLATKRRLLALERRAIAGSG